MELTCKRHPSDSFSAAIAAEPVAPTAGPKRVSHGSRLAVGARCIHWQHVQEAV